MPVSQRPMGGPMPQSQMPGVYQTQPAVPTTPTPTPTTNPGLNPATNPWIPNMANYQAPMSTLGGRNIMMPHLDWNQQTFQQYPDFFKAKFRGNAQLLQQLYGNNPLIADNPKLESLKQAMQNAGISGGIASGGQTGNSLLGSGSDILTNPQPGMWGGQLPDYMQFDPSQAQAPMGLLGDRNVMQPNSSIMQNYQQYPDHYKMKYRGRPDLLYQLYGMGGQ